LLSTKIDIIWIGSKDCLDRYEAVAVAQEALESDIINAFEDDEVYNKIRADGKPKTLQELKPS